MARLSALCAVAGATLMAQAVAPGLALHLPTPWVYQLTPECRWKPRRWVYALGEPAVARQRPTDAQARMRCLQGRGLKLFDISSVQVLPAWPDRATIARWETEDANPLPLPAQEPLTRDR